MTTRVRDSKSEPDQHAAKLYACTDNIFTYSTGGTHRSATAELQIHGQCKYKHAPHVPVSTVVDKSVVLRLYKSGFPGLYTIYVQPCSHVEL